MKVDLFLEQIGVLVFVDKYGAKWLDGGGQGLGLDGCQEIFFECGEVDERAFGERLLVVLQDSIEYEPGIVIVGSGMKKLVPIHEVVVTAVGNGECQVADSGEIVAVITGAAELFEEVAEIVVEITAVLEERLQEERGGGEFVCERGRGRTGNTMLFEAEFAEAVEGADLNLAVIDLGEL